MFRKATLYKFSLILLLIGLAVLAIAFYFFHFVTFEIPSAVIKLMNSRKDGSFGNSLHCFISGFF